MVLTGDEVRVPVRDMVLFRHYLIRYNYSCLSGYDSLKTSVSEVVYLLPLLSRVQSRPLVNL